MIFFLLVGMIIFNAAVNLKSQGTATGFEFLRDRSGFSISQVPISYTEDSTFFRAFLVGLVNTIIVSFLGIIFATILGFIVAICRLSSNYLLSKLAVIYIEILRNLPLLLQIVFFWYLFTNSLPVVRQSINLANHVFINNRGVHIPSLLFEPGSLVVVVVLLVVLASLTIYRGLLRRHQRLTGVRWPYWPYFASSTGVLVGALLITGMPFGIEVPKLTGFNFEGGMVMSPEFLALFASLSLYTAAFIAEVVRAGILAVPKGQVEAARALGLKRSTALSLVIIPQAMRVIVPPLTNQYLNLTKNSSLAAAIGYPELVAVFAGTVLNQTGQAVEVIAITMAVYLTLSLTMSLVMNIYNKKIQLTQR